MKKGIYFFLFFSVACWGSGEREAKIQKMKSIVQDTELDVAASERQDFDAIRRCFLDERRRKKITQGFQKIDQDADLDEYAKLSMKFLLANGKNPFRCKSVFVSSPGRRKREKALQEYREDDFWDDLFDDDFSDEEEMDDQDGLVTACLLLVAQKKRRKMEGEFIMGCYDDENI